MREVADIVEKLAEEHIGCTCQECRAKMRNVASSIAHWLDTQTSEIGHADPNIGRLYRDGADALIRRLRGAIGRNRIH